MFSECPVLSEQEEQEMESLSRLEERRRKHGTENDPLLKEYAACIDQRRKQARQWLDETDAQIAWESYCLEEERNCSRQDSVNGERRSTPVSRRLAAEIQGLQKQKTATAAIDPDVFYAFHEAQLLQDLNDEREGRLLQVPYLRRAEKQISDSLSAGIPVYLVGHLGSGKTQLAMEAAQEQMKNRKMHGLLKERMDSFGGMHPCASEEERKAYFLSVYQSCRKEAEQEHYVPYFVSGSHNLTAEDMFTEKTLKLSHVSQGKPYAEQMSQLIQEFMAFLKDNEEAMKDMTAQERTELMLAGWKTYSGMYINENTGYGTTVEKIEKEVLLALKEGKPVILDEINTIAMANLIALNDILQHHAGQSAYITGVGTVKIEEGFCLIGTGNLSTNTVSYEGTNVLNPAFQSRFTTIAYNYVPQSTEGMLKEQKEMGKNELFRMIIEHLCNGDGSLQLPQPSLTLDELWRLCQYARMSQDIFEGRSTVREDGDVPVLNEAVLSMRSLMHILEVWNYGEEMDLSMAIWNGFLSSVTNPDDRNLLLSLALRYGFFTENEGWHVEVRPKGSPMQTYEDIHVLPCLYEAMPLERLSREDVIELLFGKAPARTELPDSLAGKITVDHAEEADAQSAVKQDAVLHQLEHTAALMDEMADHG